MGKKDLTGRIYGGIEVIEPAMSRRYASCVTTYWKCKCLKCGSIKEFPAQRIKQGPKDCGCSKTSPIEIGKQYGLITVLSLVYDGKPKRYECRCEKCGKHFESVPQYIRKNKDGGCAECRKEVQEADKIDSLLCQYKGKEFGELTILDIYLKTEKKKKYTYSTPYALCRCRCGNEKEILLRRILSGGARTCGHNTKSVLDTGRDLKMEGNIDGTNVMAIRPDRKVNKNSSTGVTGVCLFRDGRYRAYINFKYKQYGLGLYSDFRDAVKARKAAEKEIFGNFLEWYAEEYPEQWARINKS